MLIEFRLSEHGMAYPKSDGFRNSVYQLFSGKFWRILGFHVLIQIADQIYIELLVIRDISFIHS